VDGVWMPWRVRTKWLTAAGALDGTDEVVVREAALSLPEDQAFRVDFPVGTAVWDMVADVRYTVGKERNPLSDGILQSLALDIAQEVSEGTGPRGPSERPVDPDAEEHSGLPETGADSVASRGRSGRLMVGAVLVGLVVALVLVVAAQRTRRRKQRGAD